MSEFSWPAYPETPDDFDALMGAIDGVLADEGLKPFQRPMHVGRKFWEAFEWGGLMLPPKELANAPGYKGDVLMAKAFRWYEQTYGDRLKSDWAIGYVPVKLGNAVWRVRVPVIYGRIQLFIDRSIQNHGIRQGGRGGDASLNVLCEVEGLPQGLADKLSDHALTEFFEFYLLSLQSLQWAVALPRTEWFEMAKHDFDQCSAEVLANRFGQARWAAQQAVEKTLKGLLALAATPFPKGGPNGHNLGHLAELLENHHGVALNSAVLALSSCSPKVRYGEEPSTESQALSANHCVLGVLEQLRLHPKTSELLVVASGGNS